ncbi:MAG: YlxR family protein [Clostridia bacterium]|nr:YlxR family protein [Clostridia bacterium]
MVKKIPMRRCLGCMESKPKIELIRIVKSQDGAINVDRTGRLNGRGAYFCDSIDCLDKAIKAGRISKEFEMQISKEDYEKIKEQYING